MPKKCRCSPCQGTLPASPHSPACAGIHIFGQARMVFSQCGEPSFHRNDIPPQSCWHWGIIKINHELGIVLQISAKGKTLPILRGWIPHNHSVITILCPRYRWNIPTYIRVINTFTNHLQMDIFHHSYRGTITELIRARVYHGFTHINIHHIIV